jgi:hypothetical protein
MVMDASTDEIFLCSLNHFRGLLGHAFPDATDDAIDAGARILADSAVSRGDAPDTPEAIEADSEALRKIFGTESRNVVVRRRPVHASLGQL